MPSVGLVRDFSLVLLSRPLRGNVKRQLESVLQNLPPLISTERLGQDIGKLSGGRDPMERNLSIATLPAQTLSQSRKIYSQALIAWHTRNAFFQKVLC